jgi:hypothetical protein
VLSRQQLQHRDGPSNDLVEGYKMCGAVNLGSASLPNYRERFSTAAKSSMWMEYVT